VNWMRFCASSPTRSPSRGRIPACAGAGSPRADRGRASGCCRSCLRGVRQGHLGSAAQNRLGPGMRGLRGPQQHRHMRSLWPAGAHQRPARTCSACGQRRTVAKITKAGPVCASCYQQPQRPCGRCGRLRKIAKRATPASPDLCHGCYQGTSAVCMVCGKTRPCQRIGTGSPICRQCRIPVQAEWPGGPVWTGCYEHVRRHPAPCARCQAVRPLIGKDDRGWPVCGPCAGAPGLGLLLPGMRPWRGNPQRPAVLPLRARRARPGPAR
jgi:hypothetical protein